MNQNSSEVTQLLVDRPMSEDQKRKKWDQLRSDWGTRLIQQFPSGLPPKPDFRKDHVACSKWVTEALSVYTPQSVVWGLPPLHVAGGKNYPNFMDLSLDDQCEIAETTFDDAAGVWQQAKAAADARNAKETLETRAQKAKEDREAQERRADDERVDEFVRQTTRLQSIEEVGLQRGELDDEIHRCLQRNDYRGANVARRELLELQTQAIALQAMALGREQKKSARNRRLGWMAVCFAIAGIAFGVITARWPNALETISQQANQAAHTMASAIHHAVSAAPSPATLKSSNP